MLRKYIPFDDDASAPGDLLAELVIDDDRVSLAGTTSAFDKALGLLPGEFVGKDLSGVFGAASATRIGRAALHLGDERYFTRLTDLILPELGNLIFDVELTRQLKSGSGIALRLVTTPATWHAAEALIASLFAPSSATAPSMFFISDIKAQRIRAISDNLGPRLGLGASFTYDQFNAISHPDDAHSIHAYRRKRRSLADDDFITFAQRLRSIDGEWRTIAGRSRVLARGGDGAPAKMVGVLFDLTEFNDVHQALLKAELALESAERHARKHLRRNLHDTLSQTLVAASLMAQAAESASDVSPVSSRRIAELRGLLADALEQIRGFPSLLHPPELSDLGLVDALDRLCSRLASRFSLDIAFEVEGSIPRLGDAAEAALFRVAQESLMNAHRHSGARSVVVRLACAESVARLTVTDDGWGLASGFDEAGEGVGVAGMRSRVEQLGGSFDIRSNDPGTCVTAEVRRPW